MLRYFNPDVEGRKTEQATEGLFQLGEVAVVEEV